MKSITRILPALLCLCACSQVPQGFPDDYLVLEKSASGSVANEQLQTPSPQYLHWSNLRDEALGLTMNYPSDEYTVKHASTASIQFGAETIMLENALHIADGMPHGNGISIYTTKDAKILDYLRTYGPFGKKATFDGFTFDTFQFEGMGMSYGYVTKRNGSYLVIHSMWGPDNPITEKMMRSLRFVR